jgi:hypothetical protein
MRVRDFSLFFHDLHVDVEEKESERARARERRRARQTKTGDGGMEDDAVRTQPDREPL